MTNKRKLNKIDNPLDRFSEEFISIQMMLENNPFDFRRFNNPKSLERIVQEIINEHFSLNDISNWSFDEELFWNNKNTWKLIDDRIFTIPDTELFSNSFLKKLPTLVISKLLRSKKLTLDDVKQIQINDNDILNDEHIYWIIEERSDFMPIIFNLPNNAPFFSVIVGKDWNKLDKVFKDFIAESLISNRIKFENFSEFSALELILIGMQLSSYEEIRQIPSYKRNYLKSFEILFLIFPNSDKNTQLLTETPDNIPFNFLLNLSDEHLSFISISKNIYYIKKYHITLQHLSAFSSNEMQEINEELRLIHRDCRLEYVGHDDGKPSVNAQRYDVVFNKIFTRLEDGQTSSHLSNKIVPYIAQTFLGNNNEQQEKTNKESKENTQNIPEDTQKYIKN